LEFIETRNQWYYRAAKDDPLVDADRFALALSQVAGKRLTYAELTGKKRETTIH
jgi:hypothetical protein